MSNNFKGIKELTSQYSRSIYPSSSKKNDVLSVDIMKLKKKNVHSTPEYNEFTLDIFATIIITIIK